MARILIPLPHRDFDPSEVAASWYTLHAAGHAVIFATPDGQPASADELMLSGIGLDPWGWLPGLNRLRLVGLLLRANADARKDYAAMQKNAAFRAPLRWDALDASAFDGLLLPGGHRARGMREYLESPLLQNLVAAFFAADKPVAAICHGVLLAARSRSANGKSVLHGRRTTALTWALEKKAWATARISRFWDPLYYRTYAEAPGQPVGYMSVQQEVTRALADPRDFLDVPHDAPDYRRKTNGLARDSARDASPAFVVRDGNYLSARWPGDVHRFAKEFSSLFARP
ncbi:type 1 glutamine amidotransferase domain-containing protein [Rhodanobacter sp. C05]|uniref:type 1 glutamine amidotransferase domain-containing protein n=1 Tax=Rhodanobacter sp. C05 TaxID=1945855 RepID=UPI0009847B2B|nr:type 1 glutamine amidotransferase domain-containing protein [Rhodanobacter sp. C05]OOG40196.1 thiJ/pfpI-family protein [Rhodanobacter sp. C05]